MSARFGRIAGAVGVAVVGTIGMSAPQADAIQILWQYCVGGDLWMYTDGASRPDIIFRGDPDC